MSKDNEEDPGTWSKEDRGGSREIPDCTWDLAGLTGVLISLCARSIWTSLRHTAEAQWADYSGLSRCHVKPVPA